MNGFWPLSNFLLMLSFGTISNAIAVWHKEPIDSQRERNEDIIVSLCSLDWLQKGSWACPDLHFLGLSSFIWGYVCLIYASPPLFPTKKQWWQEPLMREAPLSHKEDHVHEINARSLRKASKQLRCQSKIQVCTSYLWGFHSRNPQG